MTNDGFAEGLLAGNGYNRGNCGYGNGFDGVFGIIALLALAGGGLFGNNGYDRNGYSNEIQTTLLETSANQRQNCQEFTQTNANIANGNWQNQQVTTEWGMQTMRDIASLGTSLAAQASQNQRDTVDRLWSMKSDSDKCCCEIKQLIESKFCDLERTISGNEIARMRDEIYDLKMDKRFCGVPRVPTEWTYPASDPFCNSGCRGSRGRF